MAKAKPKDPTPPVDPPAVEEGEGQAPPPPPPAPAPKTVDPEKVIRVDFHASGHYVSQPPPRGWYYDRRITLVRRENRRDGKGDLVEVPVEVNAEHVHTDADGVWCYRVM